MCACVRASAFGPSSRMLPSMFPHTESSFARCLLCISCLLSPQLSSLIAVSLQACWHHVRLLSRFIVNIYGSIINRHPGLHFRVILWTPSQEFEPTYPRSSSFCLNFFTVPVLFQSCLLFLHLPARCQVLLFVVPCLQMARSDHLLMTAAHSKAITAASAWQPPPPSHCAHTHTPVQAGKHTLSQ